MGFIAFPEFNSNLAKNGKQECYDTAKQKDFRDIFLELQRKSDSNQYKD